MTTQNSRLPAGVLLQVLLLTFVTITPSGSTPALDLETVGSGDLRIIEDVSRWVDDPETRSMRDEIRSRSTGFEVFRSFHDREDRHAYVGAQPFGDFIRNSSSTHGVDSLLLLSVIEVESSFDAGAVSHRGAVGLMQVLPTTAGMTLEELTQPPLNIDQGARYLRRLLDRFDGDLELALAAYNAGPTNVRRYGGVPPFAETHAYVEKVLRLYVEHHRAVWQASEEAGLLLGSDEAPTARAAV